MSGQEAIELCREWMIHLGAEDTCMAEAAARGVCDLYSSRFLAWVDNRQHNLGVETVEMAASVASVDGRHPLVFVPGGVLPSAQDLADELGVALLRFDARNADLDGANLLGRRVRASGLM